MLEHGKLVVDNDEHEHNASWATPFNQNDNA